MSRVLSLLFLCAALHVPQKPPVPDEQLRSARALFKQGKFLDAAGVYRAILQKDRSSAPAYAGLVQSYLKADDVDAADQASQEAVSAFPQSAAAHAARGDVDFRQGLMADARNEYETALKLDAGCARAILGLGKFYGSLSDRGRAKEFFTRAHEIDADDGDALYQWAVLLPYPQSAEQLERHLAEYRSNPEDERREREFIALVRGVGAREVWVGPKEIQEAEIRLEPLVPRPGTVSGMGVRVKFNNTVSATLLMDTGATWMTISRKLADKIGARKISDYGLEGVGDSEPAGGYFAWVDKITVGDVVFHDGVVHVANHNPTPELDGVTGVNIFSRYSVTLDFAGRKLGLAHLADSARGKDNSINEAGTVFAFGHILLLRAFVNDSASGLFVLDSGAVSSSISRQLANKVGKLHEGGTPVSGLSGAVSKMAVLPDAVLKFSAVPAYRRDLAAFDTLSLSHQLGTEVSGFIGFDMLARTKIRINYQAGIVEFAPAGH